MSMELTRLFVVPGKEPLPDPAPSLTVEEVKGLFARQYPELTNAEYTEKIQDGHKVITFTPRYGTKG